MTELLSSTGTLEKDGKVYNVPVSNWGPTEYPLPSECDKWIKLFVNMRDNFTDEEISKINNFNWEVANAYVNRK